MTDTADTGPDNLTLRLLREIDRKLDRCLELIDRADAHVKASKPPQLTVHDGGKEDGRS